MSLIISCGIEDYIYLDPVPSGNVTNPTSNVINITLMNTSTETYFRYYSIYYRIYLSNEATSGSISEAQMSLINSTLYSDYSVIKPYTNVTSTTDISPANIEYIFRTRNYNKITIESADIETVLNKTNTSVPSPQLMVLDFQEYNTNSMPTMTLNGATYVLTRSLDSGTLNPRPAGDFSFRNSTDIRDINYISNNLDVQRNTNDSTTLCYISLYILKVGADNNWSPVYSFPTFAGVYSLPNNSMN